MFGTGILLDETTAHQAGERIRTRWLGRLRVVGRQQPVEIHELVHVRGSDNAPLFPDDSLSIWDEATRHWDLHQMRAVQTCLKEFLSKHPNDIASQRWLERIAALPDPLPPQWSDILDLDHK
jgi:hypothetical protein